jgi:hypothetical protein
MLGPVDRDGLARWSGHAGVHPATSGCYESPVCTEVNPDHVEPLDVSTAADGLVTQVPGQYVTKDSGQRQEYESGMRRDLQDGKPRFDLIFPVGVAYEDQLLTRFAGLLERGAAKYGDNNWQLANSQEELDRFRASGLRHMIQWATGETDEDHATAVIFNLMAWENTKRKMEGS